MRRGGRDTRLCFRSWPVLSRSPRWRTAARRLRAGDRVLVLKAGIEGETPCIFGEVQDEVELAPGEVCLSGGSSRVKLGQNRLELSGEIVVNGQPLKTYIEAVVSAALSGADGG